MATLGVLMLILIVDLSLSQVTIRYECKTTGCGVECNSNDTTYQTITLCETSGITCNKTERINIPSSRYFCKGTIHLKNECYNILRNQSNTSCTGCISIETTTTEKKTPASSTENKTSATPVNTDNKTPAIPTSSTTTDNKTPAIPTSSTLFTSTTPPSSTPLTSTVVAITISFTILILVIAILIVMIVFMHWRFRMKVQRESLSLYINNGRADANADLAEVDNKDPLYSVIEDNALTQPPLPPPNCSLNKDTPAPSQPSHHHGTLMPRYTDRELAVESVTQYEQPIESLRLDSQDRTRTQGAKGTGSHVDLQPYEQPIHLKNNTQNGDLSHRRGENGTKTTEFTEKCDISIPALAGDTVNPYDAVVRIDIDKSRPVIALQVSAKDTTDSYDRVERIDTSTANDKNSALQVYITDPYDRVERIDTSTASKETPTPHHLSESTPPESDYTQLNSGTDYATLEQVQI